MKCLVTGANGLLGCHLVRELLRDGHAVRAMVRASSNAAALDGLTVDRVVGDVRSAADLRRAADGCDVVFHTAAVFSYWGFDLTAMYDTARLGAHNIVAAAKDAGVRRIVLTSSTAVLGGEKQRRPRDESSRPPMDGFPHYFKSKALQEQTALEAGRANGIDVMAILPTIILGPHDVKPSASMPTLLGYITAPLQLTFPGGANIVHASDVARAHLLAAERGTAFERYVVGGENLDWTEIHNVMSDVCGLPRPILKANAPMAWIAGALMELGARVTGKPPQATRELAKQLGVFFWYDHSKAARELGYSPRPVRQTIAETFEWILTSDLLTDRQKRRLASGTP